LARKTILGPIVIESAKSMAADFVTASTVVQMEDTLSYQINITTSDSTGTFYLQGSNDDTNFVTIGTAGSAAGANDTILVDIGDVSCKHIRISYTSSVAGTGTCKIYLMARSVGA